MPYINAELHEVYRGILSGVEHERRVHHDVISAGDRQQSTSSSSPRGSEASRSLALQRSQELVAESLGRAFQVCDKGICDFHVPGAASTCGLVLFLDLPSQQPLSPHS
ncbi:unnamed protein product [Amoebophrya sp. A25]|nr:unnamed protein product [Amoebophrya sp. A25]|eukprot:GSA25T00005292001.1